MFIQLLSIIALSYAINVKCLQDFLPSKVSRSLHQEQEQKRDQEKLQSLGQPVIKGPKAAATDEDLSEEILEQAPEQISRLILFWNHQDKIDKAIIPKRLLIGGPSGCGKTALALAIARRLKTPFSVYNLSAIDDVRVASFFDNIREHAEGNQPHIVILDDTNLRNEDNQQCSFNYSTFVSSLCMLIDDCKNKKILVIAITDNYKGINGRLVSRFSTSLVCLEQPNANQRQRALSFHFNKFAQDGFTLDAEISVQDLARKTNGFSYNDLKNLVYRSVNKATAKSESLYRPNTNVRKEDCLQSIKEVREITGKKVGLFTAISSLFSS